MRSMKLQDIFCCKRKLIIKQMTSRFEKVLPQGNKIWPKARSGHCMCADDNYLYVFGGYNPSNKGKTFNELWQFNTSTNTWQLLPDYETLAPSTCASSSMVLVEHSIFVFGGTGYPFAKMNSNQMFLYSLKQKKWIDLSQISNKARDTKYPYQFNKSKSCGCGKVFDCLPMEKYGQAMVFVNNKLYIHAGTKGDEFLQELHSFDLKTFRWAKHTFCFEHGRLAPTSRYRHEIISVHQQMYIFGGATLETFFNFSQVHIYNVAFGKWEQIKIKPSSNGCTEDLPCARKAHSCVLHGKKVFMVGGLNKEVGLFQDTWCFDLENFTWSRNEDKVFPYPVQFHSTAMTGSGCMYVFGGVTDKLLRVSDLHQLWLDVPPLKRLAWLSVVKALRRNNNLSKNVLLELNIPKKFLRYIDDELDAVAG